MPRRAGGDQRRRGQPGHRHRRPPAQSGIPVIARAEQKSVAANMASFGTDHIINPYERFADSLALAVAAPQRFRLIELLTSLPETPLAEPHQPPHGHWILCGYGRFGHAVAERLRNTGIRLTIIDPTASDADHDIIGDGTEASTLRQAGIAEARASSPAATTTSTTCPSR
jgi:Trk K+ transport system NAD-binding subunit